MPNAALRYEPRPELIAAEHRRRQPLANDRQRQMPDDAQGDGLGSARRTEFDADRRQARRLATAREPKWTGDEIEGRATKSSSANPASGRGGTGEQPVRTANASFAAVRS